MARPLRVVYAGAWYHVMNRGRRKEVIFRKDKDYEGFLDLVRKSMELWQIRVAAFCLMTNHYHLLLQTMEPNLPRCMRHIDGVYTQRHNREYRHDGSLFRGRYKAVLVEKEGYIADVMKYIHKNPMKAGLENKLGEYPWTSHRGYLSSAKKWEWLAKDSVLSKITWERKERRKAYLRFMAEEDKDEIHHFYSRKNLPSVLGASEFVQWVKDKFSDAIYNIDTPDISGLRRSMDEVVSAVTRSYGISEDEVLIPRRGIQNQARDVAMYVARKWTDASSSIIARMFGLKWHSSVSNAFKRVEDRLKKDKELQSRISSIAKKLGQCQMKT